MGDVIVVRDRDALGKPDFELKRKFMHRIFSSLPAYFSYNEQGLHHKDTKTRRCTKKISNLRVLGGFVPCGELISGLPWSGFHNHFQGRAVAGHGECLADPVERIARLHQPGQVHPPELTMAAPARQQSDVLHAVVPVTRNSL